MQLAQRIRKRIGRSAKKEEEPKKFKEDDIIILSEEYRDGTSVSGYGIRPVGIVHGYEPKTDVYIVTMHYDKSPKPGMAYIWVNQNQVFRGTTREAENEEPFLREALEKRFRKVQPPTTIEEALNLYGSTEI